MSWTSGPLDDAAHHADSLLVALTTHLDIIHCASVCTAASTEDNPPEPSDSGMIYCPTTCCIMLHLLQSCSWSEAGSGR